MAVSRMTKVRILSLRGEMGEITTCLQDLECFHPVPLNETAEDKERVLHMGRVSRALEFLAPPGREKGVLGQLFHPRQLVSIEEIERSRETMAETDLVEKALHLERQIEDLHHRLETLAADREFLSPWRSLAADFEDLSTLETVDFKAFLAPASVMKNLEARIEEAGIAAVPWSLGTAAGRVACIVFFPRVEKGLEKFLEGLDLEMIDLGALTAPPEKLINGIQDKIAEAEARLDHLEVERQNLCRQCWELEVYHDYLTASADRETVIETGGQTDTVTFTDGWVPTDFLGTLTECLKARVPGAVIEKRPIDEELPPVKLENSTPLRPFEVITELYGRPHPKEADPTPILAPFFAVFFGLCLTDAVYGMLLAIVAVFLYRWAKPRGVDRRLFTLIFAGGVATIAMGAITGGWLGDLQLHLPEWLAPVAGFLDRVTIFSPLEKPLIFFGLCLVLGFIQLEVGILMKVKGLVRRKAIPQALFGTFPWAILLPCLAGWLGAGMVPALGPFESGFKWGAGVSAGLILLYGTPGENNLLLRFGAGLYALYGVTGYLGDLLSYLRLLALGLATSVIGVVINLLAGMLVGIGLIGWAAAIPLMVVGHLFNLAINLLGAFVHSSRLQYVEFFPKFFQGGGVPFSPLAYRGRYSLKRVT